MNCAGDNEESQERCLLSQATEIMTVFNEDNYFVWPADN